VIGLLSKRGQAGFGGDQDDVIIMPLKTVQRRFTGTTDLKLMLVGVDQAYSSAAVQSSIEDLLRERRNINGGKDDDFNIFDTAQISATLTQSTTLLTGIVTAVAAISLIVGGIGIMNIMLVSVTERTREIGVRMAIGAKGGDIRAQFLVEAVVLAVTGGVLGIALGVGIQRAVAYYAHWPVLVSSDSVSLAFVFSALIGVTFGFYPALKASRLDPIEALRYE